MVSKPMKRHSTSYVITEMQIKSTKIYHYTPIRIAKIWHTDSTKCWQGCRATETHLLPVGRQNSTAT